MPDDELRAARRERVFGMLEAEGLDVAVLGRRDSIAYASGFRSLWTAGTRPFGAACVLVAATRATHLLSTWEDGVPPEVPFEHLYGITWNPATMAAALRSIPGFPEAERIGVDALSPGFTRAAARLAPNATVVPIDDNLHTIRSTKLQAEVDLIRAARTVSLAALTAATDALASGATRAEALATIHRTLARQGATIPASPPSITLDPTRIDVSVLLDGYEGTVARTLTPTPTGPDPSLAAFESLAAACRPGATAADLRQAAPKDTDWLIRGIGMGYEPPIITPTLATTTHLTPNMTLAIRTESHGHLHRDIAVILDT